ncbi:MFS general substrate transporter [Lentinus tigrinus ALCF2SS1-7]|uniref:MFS general substrate transporter n=1 Tax=Lentinus tigrinus ALCF2SS1-7 TaxID=1328758 RepID=UPI001165F6DF|nr:MFS general substrate transporter [Lentinus tigrinus ALCF2SS1-7]
MGSDRLGRRRSRLPHRKSFIPFATYRHPWENREYIYVSSDDHDHVSGYDNHTPGIDEEDSPPIITADQPSPKTNIPLVFTGLLVCIFLAGLDQLYPRSWPNRTIAIILISMLLQSVKVTAAAYYLPVYFQVLGSSATGAGVWMLPFSLGSALMSVLVGQVVSRTGRWRPVMWFAWVLITLGFGLMIMLDDRANAAENFLYPLITAAGLGSLFQIPLIGLQAAMPPKDMATTTGAYVLSRALGGTVGIAIRQAIISSTVREIPHIADSVQRAALTGAYARSIRTIWIVSMPIAGAALLGVLKMRSYALRNNTRHADQEAQDEAQEKEDPTTVETTAART